MALMIVFLLSVALDRRTIQAYQRGVAWRERYIWFDLERAMLFRSKFSNSSAACVFFLRKAFCTIHRWHLLGYRACRQDGVRIECSSIGASRILVLDRLGAYERNPSRIPGTSVHVASRFSSMIRRTNSAIVTPSSLARFVSHCIWEFVNTIERFAMSVRIAPLLNPVN
jgi:hypothetical protein